MVLKLLKLSEMSDARSSLLNALKEKLLKAHVSTAPAENNRIQAVRILSNQMARMPDDMLLKTIREVSKVAALDMTAETDALAAEGPMAAIQKIFCLLRESSQPPLEDSPASLYKEGFLLLEAIEHVERYFKDNPGLLQNLRARFGIV
jgi:hypothetical protein